MTLLSQHYRIPDYDTHFSSGCSGREIFGDLLVSKIKRMIKIDDFSNFFYGHGGILDRLDSILPSFVLCFWIFFLI